MTKINRLLRINGQSDAADRLDEAEKLRAALRPTCAYRTVTDDLLEEARLDDERQRAKEHADQIERQYRHIMDHGGKALRARQAEIWDAEGGATSHAVHARPLGTTANRPYFAYGMNTNVREMQRRCPDAKAVGVYVLRDYKLVFRNFADIEPKKGAKVAGVLWLISEKCEAALDRLEGYPRAYRKGQFSADVKGKRRQVMFYVMNGRKSLSPPSAHYLRCIMEGYAAFKIDNAGLIASAQAAYDANPPMRSFKAEGNDEEFF